MIILLAFIFLFYILHIYRRLFKHTYLWQIKEYRLDRMRVYIKEQGLCSLFRYTTLIPAIGALSMILLSSNMSQRWLYMFIAIGFAYYVQRTFSTLTLHFSKKLRRPRKSLRNILIVCFVLLFTLYPILGAYNKFYLRYFSETTVGDTLEDPAAVPEIFPYVDEETNLEVTPLETATLVLYFRYLFVIDLVIPLLASLAVGGTSLLSSIKRKKKLN